MELSPPRKIRILFQVSREKLVARLSLFSADQLRVVAGSFENGSWWSLPPGIRALCSLSAWVCAGPSDLFSFGEQNAAKATDARPDTGLEEAVTPACCSQALLFCWF